MLPPPVDSPDREAGERAPVGLRSQVHLSWEHAPFLRLVTGVNNYSCPQFTLSWPPFSALTLSLVRIPVTWTLHFPPAPFP